MSVIAKAIADRQSEIERLEAEIKALNEVDKILGTSAPPAKPAARRSSSAADGGCGHPGRGDPARRQADEEAAVRCRPKRRNAVSERMTAYWAERRKKAAK